MGLNMQKNTSALFFVKCLNRLLNLDICAAKMSRLLCPVGLFPRSIIEKKLLFCGKTVVTLHRRIYGNFFLWFEGLINIL